MIKVYAPRTFSLNYLGKEWEGCYLNFNSLSYKEVYDFSGLKVNQENVKETMDKTIEVLRGKFIEGVVLNDKKAKVKISADSIVSLPAQVINDLVSWLIGGEPKKNF